MRGKGRTKGRGKGRPDGFLPVLKTLVVACEGKTEQAILNGLRARWRIATVRVLVAGQVGVPKTVVEAAINMRADWQGQFNKRDSARDKVDAWAVFDCDEHDSWPAAIDRARARRPPVQLAISNPCVELWGLLLHGEQRAAIDRHEAQRRLAVVHLGYHHDTNPVFDADVCCEMDGEPPKCDAPHPPGCASRYGVATDQGAGQRPLGESDDVFRHPGCGNFCAGIGRTQVVIARLQPRMVACSWQPTARQVESTPRASPFLPLPSPQMHRIVSLGATASGGQQS